MLLSKIKVAIADEHTLFRTTLKRFLSEQENLQVIFQVSSEIELISKLKFSGTNVLLISNELLYRGDVIRQLRNEHPEIKIVVLFSSADMTCLPELMNLGIYWFLTKNDEPNDLLNAITAASNNEIFRNTLLTESLYLDQQTRIAWGAHYREKPLNDREKKIIQLIWEERNNKEIANEIFLSVRSVEKIRQDMKEKVGVRSTVGLIKYAIDKRIIGFRTPLQGTNK